MSIDNDNAIGKTNTAAALLVITSVRIQVIIYVKANARIGLLLAKENNPSAKKDAAPVHAF